MKKSFLLLPLAVSMALSACSLISSENDGNAEVADISSATAIPNWQAGDGIQSASMPASMSSAPTRTMDQAQGASYGNGSRVIVRQMTPQAAAAQTQALAAPQQSVTAQPVTRANQSAQQEMIGQCQVVRDPAGTPVYPEMVKGCYTESSYTVGAKDTIYLISFLTGQTPALIAELNNINVASPLKVGQVLKVK